MQPRKGEKGRRSTSYMSTYIEKKTGICYNLKSRNANFQNRLWTLLKDL